MEGFKKIILPILLVILFIVVAGVATRKMQGLPPLPFKTDKTQTSYEIKTVKIGDTSIKAEVAKTEAEREKGLSGREKLEKNSGMLFVIDGGKTSPTFWMKGMKFSIDIIWIKSGRIIQIDKKVEAPGVGTPDNKLKLYNPKSAVDYVLEVNPGFSDLNNIKVGDTVLIE